jgi:hypothetical protein
MGRVEYVVVLHEGQPKINHNGKLYGPYDTRATAIRAAIDAAFKAGKQGFNAYVLVQGQDTFRVEWTYGRDPYPPST